MSPGQLRIVLTTTFLTFCTLYTPQPILPQLVVAFGIPMSEAALLVTVTLIPLGLAPIVYGYFLQAIPARTMLRIALGLLILDQIALFFASEFWHLLTLRFIQGLLMPALFTALMTYCATMSTPQKVRSTLGLYVATTIVGGFLSRALSGYLASTFGWQWVFLILGLLLIIPFVLTRSIDADAKINFDRLDGKTIGRVLAVPNFVNSYLALFTIFFVSAGILAVLPFRMTEIQDSISSFTISLVYLGYLVGIPAAIYSDWLTRVAHSEKLVLLAGLGLIIIGTICYLSDNLIVLFVLMIPLAAGTFLIHSTLSGYLNHIAREHRGVVNGIYVTVYYVSGALGSWLPVLMYRELGWRNTLVIFLGILVVSSVFILNLRGSTHEESL